MNGQNDGMIKHKYTEKIRTRQIFILGVFLLIGFFLPNYFFCKYDNTDCKYLNFISLFDENVYIHDWIKTLYASAAGLGVIIMALYCHNIIRPVLLLAIGIFPFLVIALLPYRINSGNYEIELYLLSPTPLPMFIISLFIWATLFVGSNILQHLPGNKTARVIAVLGAIVYILYVFLPYPVTYYGSVFPDYRLKRLMSLILFLPMGEDLFSCSPLDFLGNILYVICFSASSVLCILTLFMKNHITILAKWSFRLLLSGILLPLLLNIIFMLSLGSDITSLVVFIKFPFWIYGFVLLIPFGMIELVVLLSRKSERIQVEK